MGRNYYAGSDVVAIRTTREGALQAQLEYERRVAQRPIDYDSMHEEGGMTEEEYDATYPTYEPEYDCYDIVEQEVR